MLPAKPPPLFLIDASIFIFRYYFALPDQWWSEQGHCTAAVYGYSRWLVQFLGREQPDKVVACFDESLTSCFRHGLYPGYKASRALPDEALAFQLHACREMTELLGVATYASSTHEADDLIGTLAVRGRKQGLSVSILSRDKDLAQLLRHRDCLWDFPAGERLGYDCVRSKFGVSPDQLADYLALVGDPGDDIPGVPGVGAKTAAALLDEFKSIPALLRQVEQVAYLPMRGAAGLGAKLAAHGDQLMLMRRLTRIALNAPLGRRMRLSRRKPDRDSASDWARFLNLGDGFLRELEKLSPDS